jgi:hypothetical protein
VPSWRGLSLLKNLSGLGIGLPMKIATDDYWSNRTLVRCCGLGTMHGFWAPLHPSDTVVKRNAPAPKRVRLFGRHNSSVGATFVAMMQTTDLRERNNLNAARPRTILV